MNHGSLKYMFTALVLFVGLLPVVMFVGWDFQSLKSVSMAQASRELHEEQTVDKLTESSNTVKKCPTPEIPKCDCKQPAIQREPDKYTRTPNCQKLFDRSFTEFAYAEEYMSRNPRKKTTPEDMTNLTKNCDSFIASREYMMEPTSTEEKEFTIAYVITAYTDIGYLERLLKAIYTPQNLYCIHIDLKSSKEYFAAVTSIASCFPNMIMSSERFDVGWGKWSQVEANLQCMRDLIAEKYWGTWKYIINLTGHEFPMKTNWELVKALKAYKGNNDFSGSFLEGRKSIARFAGNRRQLPHNVTYAKGEIHGLFTQRFVKFMFTDPKAIEVSNYIRDYSKFPDEGLFQVLNYNPSLNAPGGFLGTDEQAMEHWINFWPVRFKVWAPSNSPMVHPYLGHGCRHAYDHGICCYGIEDMRYIVKYANRGPHLFLNKLRNNPYLVYDCIEKDFLARRKVSHSRNTLDTKLWSDRNVVKYGRGDGLL